MEVLLTNDDGYDSPGLHALAAALDEVGDVTIVAPAENQSATGRLVSDEVDIERRERGYAVVGTPVDSVLVGIDSLDLAPDLVVSGCNVGANVGGHALGRSGTVSAAVEATLFGVPAIAVSLYIPLAQWPMDPTGEEFREGSRAATYLARHARETEVFENGGYLNVNAPLPGDDPARMRVTRPSERYEMTTERDGETVRLHDRSWERMTDDEQSDPIQTDRGAVVRGEISVSPLTAPQATFDHDSLEALVSAYAPGMEEVPSRSQ